MPSRTQNLDDELEADIRDSYQQIATREKVNRSTAAILQKMGKLFLKMDADFDRPNRRAANALKQLCGVPLNLQNSHWALEQSIRQAARAALVEQAEGEHRAYEASRGKDPTPEELDLHKRARATLEAAFRTDASDEDLERVRRAIKKLAEDGGGDDDAERRPYLMREKDE
jgi:hypothetical protein